MAQFDVYPNPNAGSRQIYPYIVDIQSPYLEALATRIVVPLGRASTFGNKSMRELTPEITFAEDQLLLLTPQLSSMRARQLQRPVGSLAHAREMILNAVDFALLGR